MSLATGSYRTGSPHLSSSFGIRNFTLLSCRSVMKATVMPDRVVSVSRIGIGREWIPWGARVPALVSAQPGVREWSQTWQTDEFSPPAIRLCPSAPPRCSSWHSRPATGDSVGVLEDAEVFEVGLQESGLPMRIRSGANRVQQSCRTAPTTPSFGPSTGVGFG